MSSYNLLIPWDEEHLLFLESELTEEAGQYHLSAYNIVTGGHRTAPGRLLAAYTRIRLHLQVPVERR
ncbi:hypothetical protein ACFSQ7_26195 [Paenibacillus rhizoplanae]